LHWKYSVAIKTKPSFIVKLKSKVDFVSVNFSGVVRRKNSKRRIAKNIKKGVDLPIENKTLYKKIGKTNEDN
jgi:hypothetical protein